MNDKVPVVLGDLVGPANPAIHTEMAPDLMEICVPRFGEPTLRYQYAGTAQEDGDYKIGDGLIIPGCKKGERIYFQNLETWLKA